MTSKKILLACLVGLPCAAYADGFQYTYLDAGYIDSRGTLGLFDADGNGFGVGGAYAFNRTVNAFADYSNQHFSGGLDGSSYDFGVGGHWAIQKDLDFLAGLSWVHANVDTAFGSANDNGLGVRAGVRYRYNNKLELQGGINDVNISGANTALDLAARYCLSDQFAVGGGVVIDNGSTGLNIGVRALFWR
jgi:hypothetical protein